MEIIIEQKYPEFFEAKFNGLTIRSYDEKIVISTIKEICNDCKFKVNYLIEKSK